MFVSFLFYLRPPTIRVLYAIAIALSTEYARGYFQSASTLRNATPIVGYRPSRIVGNLSLKIQPLFKNHLSLYQWSLHPWHGKLCLTMNSFFFCSMQVVESPSIRLFHSFFFIFNCFVLFVCGPPSPPEREFRWFSWHVKYLDNNDQIAWTLTVSVSRCCTVSIFGFVQYRPISFPVKHI